jgi:L1 cell adhesion molecule like protein
VDILLRDVTPLSLGIEIRDDFTMSVVVPRNTPTPTKMVKEFTTFHDNQVTVNFLVYEGESASTKDSEFQPYLNSMSPSISMQMES